MDNSCQLSSAYSLAPGAGPRATPPRSITAATCHGPSSYPHLRPPRPQAAAVGVIPGAAGHVLGPVRRELLPPLPDGRQLHWYTVLDRAPRQCRQCLRLGTSQGLLPQRMPPRAAPPAVHEVFRLAALAQPRPALPLGGRKLRHRIASNNAQQCRLPVRRQVQPSQLALDPVPLDLMHSKPQLGAAGRHLRHVLAALGSCEPLDPHLLFNAQRLLQDLTARPPALQIASHSRPLEALPERRDWVTVVSRAPKPAQLVD